MAVKIKGIKSKKMWAVFAYDGDIQLRTIAISQKLAKDLIIPHHPENFNINWEDYAAAGYTTNKILIDIKIL